MIYLINLKAADDAQNHAEDLGEIAEDAAEDIYIDVKDLRQQPKKLFLLVSMKQKKPPKMFLKKLQKQKKMLKMQRKT